jgi:hypothetical protein
VVVSLSVIPAVGGPIVTRLDERTKANLDVALEEACRELPHGGDHGLRKSVAQKLLLSARKGNATLGGLSIVARAAVMEAAKQQKSA